jgi:hypothetical protein
MPSTSTSTSTTTSSGYITAQNTFAKRDAAPVPTAFARRVAHADSADFNKRSTSIPDMIFPSEGPAEKMAMKNREVIPVHDLEKRDGKVPYPGWLPKAALPALVSSACSCYVTPPAKITITSKKTTGTVTTTTTVCPLLTSTSITLE